MDEVGNNHPPQSSEQALGQHLQAARKAAGLTQQELCQKAGLSYSTLAKIERGAIKSPSIFTIQNIAKALGISMNQLLGGGNDTSPAVAEAPPAVAQKKRSKSGIRFVYFDVNGCLVRFFHRAFTNIAHDTGASTDIIETTFWHYNDAACRGELTMDEFGRLIAERIGQQQLDWPKYYLDAVDPIAEMHTVITWVAENYHLGLLTNIMQGLLEALLQRGLIPNVKYDTVIDSSKVGAIKPEPKIYELAQEQSRVEPHEILLVDDSRTNLMAAERMGWHVLWFDDFHPEESIARIKASLEPEELPPSQPIAHSPTPLPQRNLY